MLLGVVTALGYCMGGNLGQCLVSRTVSSEVAEQRLSPTIGSLYYGLRIREYRLRPIRDAGTNQREGRSDTLAYWLSCYNWALVG